MAIPFTFFTFAVAQCEPATLQWSGGIGPYDVVALDASRGGTGGPGGVLASVAAGLGGNTYLWPDTALPANALVVFQITDSRGNVAKTDLVAVACSDDSTCLPPLFQPTVITQSNSLAPTPMTRTTQTMAPSSASKPQFPAQTGLIIASITCSLLLLAFIAAGWYWYITRRHVRRMTKHLNTSFIVGNPARAETPMWGNANASVSKLSVFDFEGGARDSVAASSMDYQPRYILTPYESVVGGASQSPSSPHTLGAAATVAPSSNERMDITMAYSWPYGQALTSPTLPPPGGLTPMPPRPTARRERSEGFDSGPRGRRGALV